MQSTGFSLLLLVAAAGCSAAADRRVLYDRRVTPQPWSVVARASKHQRLHVLLAVQQQNLDALDKKFWAVSDPKSSEWQQFMSKDEIGELVKSKAEDMDAVVSWLKAGLSEDAVMTQSHDSVDVRLSVKDAERLFETEILIYTHSNGHTILRTQGKHSVPQEIGLAIEFVEGLADFPQKRSDKTMPKKRSADDTVTLVAPQTLVEMYSIPKQPAATKVSQGAAEFQGDTSYNQVDLSAFFNQTGLAQQKVSDIVGPYDGTVPDTEASLDVQYIMGVGQNQVDWYWTSDLWMYAFSNNFFNTKEVPDAVSISWGWAENQQCSAQIAGSECTTIGADSQQYVARTNTEFQKIGLRGVSLFVASGDSGANGRTDPTCTDGVLHSSFPGSSPYVTTVGATMLQNPKFELANPPPACSSQGARAKCASGGTEVAVSSAEAGFTSGGGFSTYTKMPSYQKAAVSEYLSSMASKLPPATYFNSSNRAYPDLSAMGSNYLVYMQVSGGFSPVGGTSAATPAVAGIAAYLNDYSYQKSGKPLGFLNPLLYQMYAELPGAFTDVTSGDNKCTESGCFASCQGYYAAKGWDPVTGLGTPVASQMLAYLEKHFASRASLSEVIV
ncbi:unnamed protein product [Polarella glacialis]|uniref:subtilisin n=1 Tax=Polarella glacialis TaxID=89957 RepID=A0A813E8G6_POLGL|nr:unnamed protein product [Polarella glacialis]